MRALRCLRRLLVPSLLLAAGRPARAQGAPRLALPGGGTVEVLGLRRWTLAMLQDSLARRAPGDSLQSHACAATLRYTLGFADAASTAYTDGTDTVDHVVVSVREPQDSARVRYRALPLDTAPGRQEWRPVTALLARRPAAFWAVVRAYTAPPGMPGPRRPLDPDAAAAVAFLRNRTTARDRRAAQAALAGSPHLYDRAAAALILGNFPSRDDTWWALVQTMRERDGVAKGVAAEVLQALSLRVPRVVNWAPAADGVRAMLDGTSLFVLPTLVRVLPRTGVGPAQARLLLGGGGDMLPAYLESANPNLAGPAHALLVQLRGADLGPAPGPWRAWIAGLPGPGRAGA